MKKLMIAAAIVCVAVSAQAFSSVEHYVTGVTKPTGSTSDGWSAYLYSAADRDAVLKSFSEGTVSEAYALDGELNIFDVSFSRSAAVLAVQQLDPPAGSQYFSVVVDSTKEGDPFKWYVVGDVVTIYGSSKGYIDTSLTGKQWGEPTEPVPEPTSGLLVLLGVAGLALKRKRA